MTPGTLTGIYKMIEAKTFQIEIQYDLTKHKPCGNAHLFYAWRFWGLPCWPRMPAQAPLLQHDSMMSPYVTCFLKVCLWHLIKICTLTSPRRQFMQTKVIFFSAKIWTPLFHVSRRHRRCPNSMVLRGTTWGRMKSGVPVATVQRSAAGIRGLNGRFFDQAFRVQIAQGDTGRSPEERS